MSHTETIEIIFVIIWGTTMLAPLFTTRGKT